MYDIKNMILSNGKCKERLDEANSLCRRFGPNGRNSGRIERAERLLKAKG